MNSSEPTTEPKLDKPGAGLPVIEWAMAKYVIFPKLFATTDKAGAIHIFSRQTEKIVALARGLDGTALAERRLVPRLRGLEDNSRYWSVAMTMQHLIIVGGGIGRYITKLSSGDNNIPKVGTADVKPAATVDAESIIKEYESMSAAFVAAATAANVLAHPNVTHPHPWFGPLNAHQWLVVAGAHQRIHKEQIEAIIARL